MSEGFWPWWSGGLAVAGIAVLYPLLTGRLLGVSSLYASLFEKRAARSAPLSELEAALLAETEAEFGPGTATEQRSTIAVRMQRLRLEAERSRPWFLVGMLLGPALFVWALGGLRLSFTLGERFDARYGSFGALPAAVLVVSGVLIGFGARLGGGCTSGHGISGFARGERGSLLTTFVFWTTALVVAWLFALFGRS